MKQLLKDGIDAKEFAKRIKEARGTENQKAFANRCHLTPQAISKYEHADADGGRLPSIGIAASIAKAAGVSLDWLVGLSENKEPNNGNHELNLKTYWDLYSALKLITDCFGGTISVNEVEIQQYDPDLRDALPRAVNETTVTIHDDLLSQYQKQFETIEALAELNAKTDDNLSVFFAAKSAIQKQMEERLLPILRVSDNDNELPF